MDLDTLFFGKNPEDEECDKCKDEHEMKDWDPLKRMFHMRSKKLQSKLDNIKRAHLDNLNGASNFEEKQNSKETYKKIKERVIKEQQITQQLEKIKNGGNHKVIELRDKTMGVTVGQSNIAKLKGKFDLRMNHGIGMKTKIEKLGQDPVAFHLHKQRNFVRKIQVSQRDYEKAELQKIEDSKQGTDNLSSLLQLSIRKKQLAKQRKLDVQNALSANIRERKSSRNLSIQHIDISCVIQDSAPNSIESNKSSEDDVLDNRKSQFVTQSMPIINGEHSAIIDHNKSFESVDKIYASYNTNQGSRDKLSVFERPNEVGSKFKSQKRDYYRYNMLYNRLNIQTNDQMTLNNTSPKSSRIQTVKNRNSQNRYQNSQNILISARNEAASQSVERIILKSPTRNNTISNVSNQQITIKQQLARGKSIETMGSPEVSQRILPEISQRYSMSPPSLRSRNSIEVGGSSISHTNHVHQNQVRNKIDSLIRKCSTIEEEGKKQGIRYEIQMDQNYVKNKDFKDSLKIIENLKNYDKIMLERAFTYEASTQDEYIREGVFVTRDYKNGLLDPTNQTSKYEQQAGYKKRQQLIKRKKKDDLDF